MKGTIIKRGQTYTVVIDVGKDPTTGKRQQNWYGGYRTKKAAEVRLGELLPQVHGGTYTAPGQ